MNARKIVLISVLVVVSAMFVGVKLAMAGAPYPPVTVSPPNHSQATSNPPTLCANVGQGDPEGQSVQIKFEAHDGGSIQHISQWLNVDSAGNVCWTDSSPWSPGWAAWQVRAQAGGEQSGASPEWIVEIVQQSGSGGGNNPPPVSESCRVNDLYADRAAPQVIGTTVIFTANASCDSGVAKIKWFVDGNKKQVTPGGSGNFSWDTGSESPGNHVVSVEAVGNSGGRASRSHPYDLIGAGQAQPDTSCPAYPQKVNSGDTAIIVGTDLNVHHDSSITSPVKFVVAQNSLVKIISGPRCNEGKRWFEIGQNGNGGWAVEVSQSGDYHYIRNGDPIPPQSGGNSPSASNDTTCPSKPAQLKVGKNAIVSSEQIDFIRMRELPDLQSEWIMDINAYEKVSIVSGPKCGDSFRWWKIGYEGKQGWAAEVGQTGIYNLIPDGDPIPPPNKSGESPPTEVPPPIEDTKPSASSGSSGSLSGNNDTEQPQVATEESKDPPFPFNIGVETSAAELVGRRPFTTGQCTWWVTQPGNRPDALEWLRANDAYPDKWVEDAINAGISVSYASDPHFKISQVKEGDIVVLPPNCQGAEGRGHVALVIKVLKDSIKVSEYNAVIHLGYGERVLNIKPCMSFIHSKVAESQNVIPPPTPQQKDVCNSSSIIDKILCFLKNMFK